MGKTGDHSAARTMCESKRREEILMVQILYFIHIPTIKHFEFETIKKQQKEKR